MESQSRKSLVDENQSPYGDTVDKPPRIDFKYIVEEIGSVLSFKKGVLYTIRELITRPGQSVKSFLDEDRKKLVKPIIFLIFCSFVYTILQEIFHFEDTYYDSAYEGVDTNSTLVMFFDWMRNNVAYVNIFASIFLALSLKALFRKHNYNLFELLILLIYLTAIGMLIFGILGLIESLTGIKLFFISALVGVIYTSWGVGQFFGKKNPWNYFKGLLGYLIGTIIFTIFSTILGLAIDLIMT